MHCKVRFVFVIAISFALSACRSAPETASQDKRKEDDALKLGVEACIYGYPLVLVDVSRQVMTAASTERVNQFSHKRAFPDYTFTDVVSPNADTLYFTSWLDLTKNRLF